MDLAHYDEQTRCHRLGGRPVPSVTQILRVTGVSSSFAGVDPVVLEHKRQIGHAVHAATHYYDEGDLIESTVSAEVRPYLEAWKAFRAERRFTPTELETVVASRMWHYIGRLDRLGTVPGEAWRTRDLVDSRVLVDIKCGDPSAAAADLQTAGYLAALLETRMHVGHVRRWSVQLRENGTYALREYPLLGRTDTQDINDFRALARAVNLRQERSGGTVPCW